jgi:hypothetical protein
MELIKSKIVGCAFGQIACSSTTTHTSKWVDSELMIEEDRRIGSVSFRLIKIREINRRKYERYKP